MKRLITLLILIIHMTAYCQNENVMSKNLWGIYAGYFPDINDKSYVSSGISASITFESLSDNFFNWGWYSILRKTFEPQSGNQPDGSFSLGVSLDKSFSTERGRFLAKVGLGVGYPVNYINITNIISIEYQHKVSQNLSLSISLTEEIVRFNLFLPPLINIGIIF